MNDGASVPGVDQLLRRAHRLTDQVLDVGTTVPATAVGLLQNVRAVLAAAPGPAAAVNVLADEVAAKRALVRALIEQLEAFDKELEVLERTLVPLQEWGHQWQRLQALVTGSPRG